MLLRAVVSLFDFTDREEANVSDQLYVSMVFGCNCILLYLFSGKT